MESMSMEQGLYAQVVMHCRKYLKITEANQNRNEDKFRSQGQYERPQRWFDVDSDCIEEKFSKREPGLYRKIFQMHDKTKNTNTLKHFEVPIGNSKCVEKIRSHSKGPMLKFC